MSHAAASIRSSPLGVALILPVIGLTLIAPPAHLSRSPVAVMVSPSAADEPTTGALATARVVVGCCAGSVEASRNDNSSHHGLAPHQPRVTGIEILSSG